MKKILVLAIMALGISTNVFACFGNSMIESIMADKIIRSKELEYDESLVDILYSLLNYELEHRGYGIFGINMGYESTLYFVVPEKTFFRIDKEPELFTIFDIGFLETIYSEIYQITGELGIENVNIGDFLEKRGNEYYTLFMEASKNVIIENIDENDESKVKIIL